MAQDFTKALETFCQLIGLFDKDDSLQWDWFSDPLGGTAVGMSANREKLRDLFQALTGTAADPKAPAFDEAGSLDLEWEPTKAGPVSLGLVWNKDAQPPRPLDLGFGAAVPYPPPAADPSKGAAPVPAKPALKLTLRAGLAQFDGSTKKTTSALGNVVVSADLPVPDFLTGGKLTISRVGTKFVLSLNATNKAIPAKTLAIQFPSPAPGVLPWDAARLAAFVAAAFVKSKGEVEPKGFWHRLDAHFFPLFGDPSKPASLLPPLDPTGQPPKFQPWADAVTGSPTNALTALWHLRALVTGNEDTGYIPGSAYYQIFPEPPSSGLKDFLPTNGSQKNAAKGTVWVALTGDLPPKVPLVGTRDLQLVVRGDKGEDIAVPVAHFEKGALQRPAAASFSLPNQFAVQKGKLAVALPGDPKNPVTFRDTNSKVANSDFEVVLARQSIGQDDTSFPAMMRGDYSLGLLVSATNGVSYNFSTPMLHEALPPPPAGAFAADAVTQLLTWGLSQAFPGDNPVNAILGALIKLTADTIQGGTPSPFEIIAAVVGLAASGANKGQFDAGPFTLLVKPATPGNPDTVAVSVQIPGSGNDPIAPRSLGGTVTVGKLEARATLSPSAANPIAEYSLAMHDLRLGESGGSKAGLTGMLIPDLRDLDGFDLVASSQSPHVTGGGKVVIQRTLGGVEIVALIVTVGEGSLKVGLDLFLKLGPITVAVYDLSLVIPFVKNAVPTPFLRGLGVSFDAGGIKLAGLFLNAGGDNYVGAATISVAGLFSLGAIGGYGRTAHDDGQGHKQSGSMFIFASLAAPLGGPPFFFVTGIAGGFGYNRGLPAVDLRTLADHIFFQVMEGAIHFDPKIDPQQPGTALDTLAGSFPIVAGRSWAAAGLQFTCFGLIHGKVVATVAFGKNPSFHLIGLLTFSIKPVAYFELAFEMSADATQFLMRAGISASSYIIDPSIAKLCGDFALGAWYAGEAAGDFVVSVGGYHPCFTRPKYYPDLARVSCKAMIDGVHLAVEGFFACTPQALMAGASVSLYGEFADISAGLDVYVDVLINWDPFHLKARMGIAVWFHFCGRHEVGVDLLIYTPDFGGTASIDLWLVSFDVDFGADEAPLRGPLLHEFVSKQLATPAQPAPVGISLAAFNNGGAAGLFHVDFTTGRVAGPPPDEKTQEGLGAPMQVNAEFALTIKTKLPIGESFAPPAAVEDDPRSALQGTVNLPLCRQADLWSRLTITSDAGSLDRTRQSRLTNLFPAANFGALLPEAQSDDDTARNAISKIDTKKPSVPLTEGIAVNFAPTFDPPEMAFDAPGAFLDEFLADVQSVDDEYPLPLGGTKPGPNQGTKSAVSFKAGALPGKLPRASRLASSQQVAAQRYKAAEAAPLNVALRRFSVERNVVDTRTFTLASPAANVPVIEVPTSPVRRSELAAVRLGLAPARLAGSAPRDQVRERVGEVRFDLPPVQRPGAVLASGATLPGGPFVRPVPVPAPAPATGAQTVSLLSSRAGCFVLTGGPAARSHTLTCNGPGNARVVYLGGSGEYLGDSYIAQGSIQRTPARARQIFLLSEGLEIPVAAALPIGTQVLRENIGVERDSTLLRLDDRTFAAHGCTLQSLVTPNLRAGRFDALTGAQVLGALTRFRLYFPAMQKGVTLALILEPRADDPAPALGQVRWAAAGATLGSPSTVVGPDHTALLMNVEPTGNWSLDLDVGRDWRFAGIVVATTASRDLGQRLQQGGDWDFIDDRIATGATETAINVTLNP